MKIEIEFDENQVTRENLAFLGGLIRACRHEPEIRMLLIDLRVQIETARDVKSPTVVIMDNDPHMTREMVPEMVPEPPCRH